MLSKKEIQVYIVIPVVVLTLIIAWYVMYYTPLDKAQKESQRKILVLEGKIEDKVTTQQVDMLQFEIDSLEKYLKSQEARVYPVEKLLGLGNELKEMVKPFGLKVITITPDFKSVSKIGPAMKDVGELPLTINFQATFNQFSKFLDGVPDLPYVLRVNEISIQKPEKGYDLLINIKGVIVLRKERVPSVDNSKQKVSHQV